LTRRRGLHLALGAPLDERDSIHFGQALCRTLKQGPDQFRQRHFAFPVDNHVNQTGPQRPGGDLAKKATPGDHAGARGPGDPRQPQALDTTDGLFANTDKGRPAPVEFGLEGAPAHLQRRRVQDLDPQVPDLLAQHGRQRGEGQRRPEGAAGAVERP